MDIQAVDPVSLDIPHRVDKVSFRFYSENEALRISVRRLTSPYAFDELGRPLPRGLYDPALGPAAYPDGPCVTCNLTYNNCPGHFGHVELPFAVVNPLLSSCVLKILRASCWRCPRLRLADRELNLLLARLYFEDADLPKASFAVEAYRTLRIRTDLSSANKLEPKENAEDLTTNQIVKNWSEFLRTMPSPIPRYMEGVDYHDGDLVELNMLRAARNSWKEAHAEGRLAKARSKGWKQVEGLILHKGSTKCYKCFQHSLKIRRGDRGRLFVCKKQGDTLLSSTEVEAQIRALWKLHSEMFELLYGLKGRTSGRDCDSEGHMRLFVRIVLVPPSRFRPTSIVGNMAYAAEHPQNMFFQRLLTEINIIMTANEYGLAGDISHEDSEEEAAKKRPTKARFAQAMTRVPEVLRDLYDSEGMTAHSGTTQMTGIRQQLEAKDGLFRRHMMGKRVNYSCRSVIGPDVFLDTTEVGIPESFAKLLTVPEPVIPGNLDRMRQAVLNGPDVYPGAVAVEDWNTNGEHRIVKFRSSKAKKLLKSQAGLLIQNRLTKTTNGTRQEPFSVSRVDELSDDATGQNMPNVPKRVHRHLKTGDVVLFNRQPTLHRVSIMAHRVRVLPDDRTIRFHYANCGSYNADFDGDEMNIHVPQDLIAQAEAEELMLSSKHYIVPTSGAPVRGLIQDHIAAATLLSRRDTFLNRETFMQLLYSATEKVMLRPERECRKYAIPRPAILRPHELWTGKQLISAVLSVVREGRPGLNLEGQSKTTANFVGQEESQVLFRRGELLTGIIDKNSLGASMYGIVHAVQEVYGCDVSEDFLSSMGRLCLFFLRTHGHTTGIEDLLLDSDGEKNRISILRSSIDKIGVDVTNAIYTQMNRRDKGETRHAKSTREARDLLEDLIKKNGIEAEDRLDSAMKSALSKTTSDVMKACMPACLQKPFPSNGFSLMTTTGAKGSALNAAQISCLLGSTVLEGKRVPRMGGSGATLPCFEPYDSSPIAGGFITGRFLTGISPHEFFFHAMSGREGLLDTSLKTANSGYLQRCLIKHLEGTQLSYDGSVRDSDNSVLQFVYGDDGIDPSKARWLSEQVTWQLSNIHCLSPLHVKGNVEEEASRTNGNQKMSGDGTLLKKASLGAMSKKDSISRKYKEMISSATEGESNEAELRSFLRTRYHKATMQPGEAVGILAAQGVGEPSTQMTLNTFHHAGSSSAHVTMGIPRLRELLMTASKYPKTPSMILPVCGKNKGEAASDLRKRLQKVMLLDLVQRIDVLEAGIIFLPGISDWAVRKVKIKLHLPPETVYQAHLGFDFEFIKRKVSEELLLEAHNRFKRDILRIRSEGVNKEDPALSLYIRVAEKPVCSSLHDSYGETQNENRDSANDDGDKIDEEVGDKSDEEVGGKSDEEVEEAEHYASSSDEDDEDDDEGNEEKQDKNVGTHKVEGHLVDKGFAEGMQGPASMKEEDKELSVSDDEGKDQHATKDKSFNDIGVETPEMENGNGPPIDYGSLGYVESSFKGFMKKALEFEWSFPAAVIGKLNIGETVRETTGNVRLVQVTQIERCFVESAGEKHCVVTEGSNLREIFEKGDGLIDFNSLETNDMFGILQTYGVEAMRAALIKEFGKVFKDYGIPVDIRHLALIADYMTAHGSYRGFNRLCMDETPSAFQRMTFETSMKFLTDAALNGSEDDVKNPSAALALGEVYQGGTGSFQLLYQLPKSTQS